MSYDHWKTTEPDDRSDMVCEKCGAGLKRDPVDCKRPFRLYYCDRCDEEDEPEEPPETPEAA